MARHNIQFTGIKHSPSDITGKDGDLLECVNLVHENGELKPIEMPENVYASEDEGTLIAIHNLTDGNKFVFANNNTINIKNDNGGYVYSHTINGQNIKWAECIGNTLIIGTDKSTHYALYKNGKYKWLGDKIPTANFSFDFTDGIPFDIYERNPSLKDVEGNYAEGGGIPILVEMVTTQHAEERIEDSTENKKAFADNLLSKYTSLISKSKKNAEFVYPFFVRYAVRLYDGSYVMHSEPILMLPSTDENPILSYISIFEAKGLSSDYHRPGYMLLGNIILRFVSQKLKLRFDNFNDIEDWSDIVKGVDIFLSSQIPSVNENYVMEPDNVDLKSIEQEIHYVSNQPFDEYQYEIGGDCYKSNSCYPWKDRLVKPTPQSQQEWPAVCFQDEGYYRVTIPGANISYLDTYYRQNRYYPLPSYTKAEIKEKIANTNLFYRVKQYSIEDLKSWKSGWRELNDEIEYGLLERLETLPTLTDDYISRSRISANVDYSYNMRLALGDIKVEAPEWYEHNRAFASDITNLDVLFKIEKNEKTIYVGWDKYNLGRYDFGHFLFYPDPDCKEMLVKKKGTEEWHIIPMYEHKGLHGAYALMPGLKSLFESLEEFPIYQETTPKPSTDKYYKMSNVISLSGVANPFYFPASNFKDIGRANVIGIAANTLDVSFGQWGQFPLYVFCSDGIVAIGIDDQGKLGGTSAVSSDVLIRQEALSQPTVVQIGQSLLFLTNRGVMSIAGTKIQCISESLNGRHFNTTKELNGVADYSNFSRIIDNSSDDEDFKKYASEGFLAYDYAHNRVILANSGKTYQYIYSLDSGTWSKMSLYDGKYQGIEIVSAVNNYTEMYMQDSEGSLYKTMDVTSENESSNHQYGYFVSRPVRFGTDEYKTITRLLNRVAEYDKDSEVKVAIYGSRDGMKYGMVNTLRGMSYRYFIFVVYTYLKPNERYSYMSVDFEERLTNKLR